MKKNLFLGIAFLLISNLFAQENIGSYKRPTKLIEDIATAPRTPAVSLNSKGDLLLIMQRSEMPTIADLAQPELRIAGLRINPANNGASRTPYTVGMKFKKLTDKNEIEIKNLPNPLKATNIRWSPNESKIAFTNHLTDKIELWLIDVTTASANKLTNLNINSAYGEPFQWIDNQSVIAKTILQNRGKAPEKNPVPTGPTIQENLGGGGGAPTFQDLLKNSHDEALFEYYCTSQLVKINISGKSQNLNIQGIIGNSEPSPDGKYLLVQTTHKPFSYLVTAQSFPRKVDILDTDGKLVKNIVDLPLYDSYSWNRDAVRLGQREHNWRDDSPATVYWVEPLDGGDPKKKVDFRDKVVAISAPFSDLPKTIYQSQFRFAGFVWGNENMAWAREFWYANRKTITKIINPNTNTEPSVLFDRSSEDRYNNPGVPDMKKNQFGRNVLALQKDGNIFMTGAGASSEGDRPFIDLLNLNSRETKRLWRSEAPFYESVEGIIDAENQIVLTSRESQEIQPNYYIRDLKKKGTDALSQITFFPNPYPMLEGVQKQLLKYKRNDGVDLSTTLYLPKGYKKENGALPAFLWAYPLEYKTKEAAGQVVGSPYRFTTIGWGSALYWVTQGYAVLDNATIPIIGEGDAEPNDTYVEQLVNSAKAAIDEGVRLGVVDASRVGVGGHSYGAFMTANLLSHSNLFKAGIARSGAYNRTLTPFGFQGENRNYWQAPDTYNKMSPFMNADKMKTPLLMIHGEADNNTGTHPIQSERYYNALKGMGATVKFVSLPYESHGYAAKESILHTLYEMDEWLNKYVKNANKGQ